MREKIHGFLRKIREITADEAKRKAAALPDNCYFLEDTTIACLRRALGDSRYPYSADGFTLWAHASGYLSVNESTFYVVLPARGGREPYFAAFGGVRKEDGTYAPVSLFDVTALPGEPDCTRYTVFTPQAVYYIAQTAELLFALRAFVTDAKQVCLTLYAENCGKTAHEIYLSPYLNCLLKHDTAESVETDWFRECRTTEQGYLFGSVEDLDRTTHLEHFGVVTRALDAARIEGLEVTTARSVYTGGTNRPLMCATSLASGSFGIPKENTRFHDTAVAAEIVRLRLACGENFHADYRLSCVSDRQTADRLCGEQLSEDAFAQYLSAAEAADRSKRAAMTQMQIGPFTVGNMDNRVLNSFLKNVQIQVEFAALAKNSGVSLLGVRDVFQQLEAALMWNPQACRAKMIEALGFIDRSGRPPRQYSIPPGAGAMPRMDLRPFIDQGVWIIDTLYTYLSYTGDYSILDEECGYYEFAGNAVRPCAERDSVLCHLIRIAGYMIDKLDTGRTNCLRAMYGDWNDALDGLGVSLDGSAEYGTGVSVMASLQLYRNLTQLREILDARGERPELAAEYGRVRELLRQGLETYAVDRSGEKRRILHGWGDRGAYKVGSFRDPDGASRDGLTANAFWVLSDLYRTDDSLRPTILESMKRLDGKFGLKTFEPYFPPNMKGVGRIVNLPKGTAENAATYVHATLFGVWALFRMGEPAFAWEQLYKLLPITHAHLSTTPFVMSNSYSHNEEYGLDGESMSDWFTGSANVLLKVFVRCVFGVNPDLAGVSISPADGLPAEGFSLKLCVKGATLLLSCENRGTGRKRFLVNGVERRSDYDRYLRTERIYLPDSELKGTVRIEIFT